MEPLSARGLPRLSWIDTLYSSTYPSIHLRTPLHTSLPIYLCARLYLLPFYPTPTPSPSHGLPVRVNNQSYMHTENTLHFLWTSNQRASLWQSITRWSTPSFASVPPSASQAYNLEVELYVPSYRGHKLSDVEFLIRSLLWSSCYAGDKV